MIHVQLAKYGKQFFVLLLNTPSAKKRFRIKKSHQKIIIIRIFF